MNLEIAARETGDVKIVRASGRLTIGSEADLLNRELRDVVVAGWKKLLVNLSGVDKIDSSGISTLVRTSITLGRLGGSLRLVCPPGRVRDALELTRLVGAIPTFEDESAALVSFR